MSVLKRLYGYLAYYKTWAIIAFGSMIIFAGTQTLMIALTQPLVDQVLSRPGQVHTQSRDSETKP